MAIEDALSYEEIERERMRLTKLATVMTLDELRIAGARIADRIKLRQGKKDSRTIGMWQLRGEIAISLYEAMTSGALKHSRIKRMMMCTMDSSPSERMIQEFTRLA